MVDMFENEIMSIVLIKSVNVYLIDLFIDAIDQYASK